MFILSRSIHEAIAFTWVIDDACFGNPLFFSRAFFQLEYPVTVNVGSILVFIPKCLHAKQKTASREMEYSNQLYFSSHDRWKHRLSPSFCFVFGNTKFVSDDTFVERSNELTGEMSDGAVVKRM